MRTNPKSKAELTDALAEVEARVAGFISSLSAEEYVLRVDSAWTPAEHLTHLNISVQAVAKGLQVPRWLLWLRFGRVRRASRSYEEIREVYLATLARGGVAPNRFVPPDETLSIDDVAAHRNGNLERWQRRNARLRAAIDQWTESQLDEFRLPHPLLGKLSAREMAFFTLYHNQHHLDGARRRLPRFSHPEA